MPTPDITGLVTPAPSGVIAGNPNAPVLTGSWLGTLIRILQIINAPVSAWEPGQPYRTLLSVSAVALASGDVQQSMADAGGLLDFAATGTVPVVDLEGNTTLLPVSPDPSTASPTPTTSNTWLDALGVEVYAVEREEATFAEGPVTLTNASTSPYSLGVGSLHLGNSTSGATYTNTSAILIPASGSVTADFKCDQIGPIGTAAPSGIDHLVTPLAGVTCANAAEIVGANWESNAAYAARCRLALAAISPNGAADAYRFIALSASEFVTLQGGPITRVLVVSDKTTGIVNVYAANGSGVVAGVVQLGVAGVTNNAGACKIQTVSAHGLTTGQIASVAGVVGVPGANVNGATITVNDSTHFTLNSSTFSGAYVSGGVVEGGDLGQLDSLIQAKVVPDAVTELTQTCATSAITFAVDIFLPVASMSAGVTAATAAITAYIASVPIGGFTDPGGSFTQVLPFDAVVGVVFAAIAPLGGQQVLLKMNGATADISLAGSPPLVPTIASLSVTPHGV